MCSFLSVGFLAVCELGSALFRLLFTKASRSFLQCGGCVLISCGSGFDHQEKDDTDLDPIFENSVDKDPIFDKKKDESKLQPSVHAKLYDKV